jgi:NitT/TauT family transport system ATP-binding protein
MQQMDLAPKPTTEAPVEQDRQTIIAAAAVSKVYQSRKRGEITALRHVSFEIKQGEFISLVGPSGCGKSTLLKMLAGLLPYSSGSLMLGGTPVRGPGQDAAMVFQAPVLLPWRTILQNVLLPIEFRRLPMEPYRRRAMELLATVGLGEFAERLPRELSGGMQQRAGIVRALVQDPRILLMDEPFGALDAMTREQMNLEVLRIWEQNRKTVLFVTHSIAESVFLADRVFVMTARPGALERIIPIDLPRPRLLGMINTEKFGSYVAEIRELLQARGDLSS